MSPERGCSRSLLPSPFCRSRGSPPSIAVAESVTAVRSAREADVEMRSATAFMEAVALWTRDDLDRRLGDRPQGPWRMTVGRPLPTLYTVALADSATRRILLRTSLFRPLP